MYKLIAALGILVSIAVFLGYISHVYHNNHKGASSPYRRTETRDEITARLIENVDPAKILLNLRALTRTPHVAGTKENNRVADVITHLWKKNGLQDVHFVKYNVLLSYPNYTSPNHVTLLDSTGNIIYQSSGISPAVIPEEQGDEGAGIQWVAYSANGTVEGDVVYCHYGRESDFEQLRQMGVSVQGKIALLRYHTEFRGSKVRNAVLNGAIGAILYSDPAECAKDGTDQDHVYPSTVWMPPKGVQRGSLMMGKGDPQTPLYPSRPELYRSRTIDEAKSMGILPSIPVTPISYSDAYQLLSRMDGQPVPLDWQGGLNITYHTGPGFAAGQFSPGKVRIEVHSRLDVKEIRNVIGYIHGAEQPDEYVILGNHYDAWVYGSIDPNSGTATLAEVGRSLTQTMQQTGWRPARTIMFCAWDAEEYGLIGSTEFVEEFANILNDRAIVYMNVDLICNNQSLGVASVPTMYDVVVNASKKIPNPVKKEVEKGKTTVYDTWISTHPPQRSFQSHIPDIKIPGGGSDHQPFLNYLAIPVIDFTYGNPSDFMDCYGYPLYHSLYETPFLNEHLFDTDHFAVHRATGQVWAELARSFADEPILPLGVPTFAQVIVNEYVPNLKASVIRLAQNYSQLQDAVQQTTNLEAKGQEFLRIAEIFQSHLTKLENGGFESHNRAQLLASMNKRLKAVDRCFLNPRGMPGNVAKRNVLYSLSSKNVYAGEAMSAVYDQLAELEAAASEVELSRIGREVAQQISIVQYSIQCAINSLGRII